MEETLENLENFLSIHTLADFPDILEKEYNKKK